MTLDDIRRLNIRDVGNWPLLPKIVRARRCIFLAIVAAGALLRLEGPVRGARPRRRQEEQKLREQYTEKKAKAVNSTSTSSS